MDAIPDRIFFKESRCRYIRANMPAARDFGLSSPREIVGRTIMQLAPSSIAARVQQEDDAVLGSAKPLLDRIIELPQPDGRSEEHTSELQSLMRISYAVFCLKKKNQHKMTIQS